MDGTEGQEEAGIAALRDWLAEMALGSMPLPAVFAGCCERLGAAGIPLARGYVSFRTLHPLHAAGGLAWRPGGGVTESAYPHDDGASEAFLRSPLHHMVAGRLPRLRRRLAGPEARVDFPVLDEFRDAGATDWAGYLVHFGSETEEGILGSWLTDRPGGFTEADLHRLAAVERSLALACKLRIREEIARSVVTAYLGRLAGRRVLDGQIRRGDGETIAAAVWYSDLRGSTDLADSLPRDAYIATLNAYFECAGGAVQAEGGEILAFIGDAVLAIFPAGEGGPEAACRAALRASADAGARLADANAARAAAGQSPLAFGVGLHFGDVIFGNIGLPDRVSFSVIGPTVNEVARLEALTKTLARPVVVSGAFARHVPVAWEPAGRHRLRGVQAPVDVYVPPASPAGDAD